MSSEGGTGAWYDAVRRRCPAPLTLMRLGLVLGLGVMLAVWFNFRWWQERTIVVDAQTGALDIVLDAEMSGKAFLNVWSCKRVSDSDPTEEEPPKTLGCPPRTHHLVAREDILVPVLPAGAHLKVMSLPGMVRIEVIALPKAYEASDLRALDGGALILLDREALDAFGSLSLSGRVRIGAEFFETDRRSTTSGRYQIRGYAPFPGGDLRELRGDELLGGALVRFVDDKGRTATGHVAIMLPDPESDLMQVTAISRHSTDTLGVSYYFTEEVRLRPSFLEALLLDPVFQFLVAVFGAIAGYGWLKKMVGPDDAGKRANASNERDLHGGDGLRSDAGDECG